MSWLLFFLLFLLFWQAHDSDIIIALKHVQLIINHSVKKCLKNEK